MSAGFNPRHRIVFALPMQTGVEGTNEICEIKLTDGITCAEFIHKMNTGLPDGFSIKDAKSVKGDSKIMSAAYAADYEIIFGSGSSLADLQNSLNKFMSEADITAEKRTKSGEKPVNIKPMILDVKISNYIDNDNENNCKMKLFTISVCLKAGEINLKPTLFFSALKVYDPDNRFGNIHHITRTNIYANKNGLVNLFDMELQFGK